MSASDSNPAEFNPEDIAKVNPGVDLDQLRKVEDLLGKLREHGLPDGPGYTADSPYRRGLEASRETSEHVVAWPRATHDC